MDSKIVEEKIDWILKFHIGQKNAIERWELVTDVFGPGADIPRTDKNRADRAIRRAIEKMRSGGRIICNLGNGAGWFLPATEKEYREFRAMYGAHAFPILTNIREMDRTAQAQWPNVMQPGLL